MKNKNILLPLYYQSIRDAVLDFSKILYAGNHGAVFIDGDTNAEGDELPNFKLEVFQKGSASSKLLFSLEYSKGQEIMKVNSGKPIKYFEDGVYISDGNLPETLELLLKNSLRKK